MIDLLIDRPCRTLGFVVKNTSKSFAAYSGGNSVPVSPTLRSVHSLHRIALLNPFHVQAIWNRNRCSSAMRKVQCENAF